jgi:hypothetical protein
MSKAFQLRQFDRHVFNFPVERERGPVKVVQGDGRTEIDSYVETLAGGKGTGHVALDRCAGDLCSIDREHNVGSTLGFAIFDLVFASRILSGERAI